MNSKKSGMTLSRKIIPNKYKIRIGSTSPNMPESELFARKRCVLGISMSNPVFWRSSMNTLLQWIDQHFDECLLVVGDFLHRHNEANIKGVSAEQAKLNALQKGDDFLEHLNAFLLQYDQEKFTVARWKGFLDSNKFDDKLALMYDTYENVEGIRKSIEKTIRLFMQRRADQDLVQLVDERLINTYSLSYLLEEMAVFSNLIEDGWPVIIYPGEQLPVLVEFARGDYPQVPEKLSNAIYVELKVIKKK